MRFFGDDMEELARLSEEHARRFHTPIETTVEATEQVLRWLESGGYPIDWRTWPTGQESLRLGLWRTLPTDIDG